MFSVARAIVTFRVEEGRWIASHDRDGGSAMCAGASCLMGPDGCPAASPEGAIAAISYKPMFDHDR